MSAGACTSRQLRLGDALLLLDGFLLVVVAPAWSPGIFVKHVETTRIDLVPRRKGLVARLSTTGGPVPREVVEVAVTADQLAAFEELVAAAKEARERSLRDTPGSRPGPGWPGADR